MKGSKKRWIALGLVAVLAAGWLWSSWPRSLEALFPGFAWADVTDISGFTMGESLSEPVRQTGRLGLDTPGAAELIAAFQDVKFAPSLLGTLRDAIPFGTILTDIPPGTPLHIEICFSTPAEYLTVQIVGETVTVFEVVYNFGKGRSYRGAFVGGETLAGEAGDFLSAYSD